MAKVERPKRRKGARKSALSGKGKPPDPPIYCRRERNKAPKSATKGAKSSPRLKLKNYLLHYAKGKYYLINLSLKKKGHDQKY
jgi:hypothetical protein